MAAAKTTLVFLIFALIAVSANLQMASAVGVQCATDLSLNLNILNGCTSDTQCLDACNAQCMAKFNVNASASACVAGLLQLLVKSCSCCCASI
ncbi:hypothetical protein C5167_037567 [Papaver somniferum]|uniref:Defensin-like protein n=1 Tax=Papaver somniferum TaxID=3469 RepID=A0A4Y7IAE4_PAPSO|nr:hypothetical protein C5167_037564 [Papaver somniferum]RZC44612.1 hypothetical protein C5167_037567 [Papaver somniferum]